MDTCEVNNSKQPTTTIKWIGRMCASLTNALNYVKCNILCTKVFDAMDAVTN